MSDMVTLTLAHPLSAKQAERVRAKDVKDYTTGSKITLPRDEARAVIDAGYAQGVEPENTEAVQSALDGKSSPKLTKSSS